MKVWEEVTSQGLPVLAELLSQMATHGCLLSWLSLEDPHTGLNQERDSSEMRKEAVSACFHKGEGKNEL